MRRRGFFRRYLSQYTIFSPRCHKHLRWKGLIHVMVYITGDMHADFSRFSAPEMRPLKEATP